MILEQNVRFCLLAIFFYIPCACTQTNGIVWKLCGRHDKISKEPFTALHGAASVHCQAFFYACRNRTNEMQNIFVIDAILTMYKCVFG